MLRFDVEQQNAAAFQKWLRTYRYMVIVAFVSTLILTLVVASLVLGVFGAAIHVPSKNIGPAALILVILTASTCFSAYALFVLYRAGGTAVVVSSRSLNLEFSAGSSVVLPWQKRGLNVRISEVGSVDPMSGKDHFIQAAIQDIRHPHFELSQEAVAAIVGVAQSSGLEVTDSRVLMPQNQYWRVVKLVRR